MAAASAQRALAEEPGQVATATGWMGLHTGEGRLGGDSYVGSDMSTARHASGRPVTGARFCFRASRLLSNLLPEGVMLQR